MTRSALAMAIAAVLVGSMAIEQTALAQHPSAELSTAQQLSRQEEVSSTPSDSRAGDSRQTDKRDTTNRSDERFLKDFAQINAAEVETGKTAEWKAEDTEVKAFATHMVETHSQTIGKVKTIAVMTSVDVKEKPDFMQKAKAAFLDINVGGSFDRAYMKEMVKEHEKVIEMLEREINDGQDASVKQFASEALSDAQQHLQMAQDLRVKVYAYENAKRSLRRDDSSSAEKVAANH
jgi:putative membrane protein